MKNSNSIKNILSRIWPWILITVGSILSALGYVIFILPQKMVEGGVTGIGIIAQRLTGLPIVGLTSIVLTAFVFIVATRILGKSFGARSIYAMLLMNSLIDFFQLLRVSKLVTLPNDMLLVALYGGVIVGIGLGLIYFSGASTGGADALAQILWRTKRISISKTLVIIDMIVLGTATLVFISIGQIMYSLIFIFVEIKVIDMVMEGIQASQRVMIITDEPEKIKSAILDNLNRGMTIFKGIGAYTGVDRYMLTTVVPRKHIPEVRRLIAANDEKAFVIIQDVCQVYGEGFEPLPRNYLFKLKKQEQVISE